MSLQPYVIYSKMSNSKYCTWSTGTKGPRKRANKTKHNTLPHWATLEKWLGFLTEFRTSSWSPEGVSRFPHRLSELEPSSISVSHLIILMRFAIMMKISQNDGRTINNIFVNRQKFIPQIYISPIINLYPLYHTLVQMDGCLSDRSNVTSPRILEYLQKGCHCPFSEPDTSSIRIGPILLHTIRPKGARRPKSVLHILEIRDFPLVVDLRASRPRRRNRLLHRIRCDFELSTCSAIASIGKNDIHGERATRPPESNTRECVQKSLISHFGTGTCPGHDLMQIWVIEGQRDVGCVECDAFFDEVRIWVGLGLEDFSKDVQRGAREIGRPDNCFAGETFFELILATRLRWCSQGHGRADEEKP